MRTAIKNISWVLFLVIWTFQSSSARHIIGGEFYYEALGAGSYEFTLIVYRDCASGGALFDSQITPFGAATIGTVTIYRSDQDQPFRRIELDEPVIELIDIVPDNPCLVAPASLCVERGIYTFRTELPLSQQTYTISYQRCCRNNTINNIRNPEGSGATYTIELSALAQQRENASIQFSDFPPVVICINEPLNFDHSAFDPDGRPGTRIEYEFCAPSLGGGLAGSNGNPGRATDPNGVAPDPDLPPPYNEVQFVGGGFTAETPLGGSPVVSIDPQTGIISGTPEDLGQFVVGVCATEFDSDGNVLSRIRRDFQFNVVECDAAVTSGLEADSIDEMGNFVINACGRSQVRFFDASFQRDFVETYEWTFQVEDGEDIVSTERNPVIDFPELATYPGQLVVNKGSVCSDTANIVVNIYGKIQNDFSFSYDTCTAGPVLFSGTSQTENGEIEKRNWLISGEGESSGQSFEFEFMTPGNKEVVFEVEDSVGCLARTVKTIPYYPIPNEIIVERETNGECQPVIVQFINRSFPLDETYDIRWDFGDGGSSTSISPTYIYESAGTYTVGLEIESPIGCSYKGELDGKILVLESPTADFTYSPRSFDQLNSTANFRDLSQLAEQWEWSFGGFGRSIIQNPSFTFPDTGKVRVDLTVVHNNGCRDTASQILDIIPKPLFFLPNAFRPAGQNTIYRGTGALPYISQFEMQIFDRWGAEVFSSQDPEVGWNGRRNNSGNMMPAGVYICYVSFVGPRGNAYQLKEFATLIR